jgi:hypothetical protein
VEEEVRGEAWEVVNESFLPDAGSSPWSRGDVDGELFLLRVVVDG